MLCLKLNVYQKSWLVHLFLIFWYETIHCIIYKEYFANKQDNKINEFVIVTLIKIIS